MTTPTFLAVATLGLLTATGCAGSIDNNANMSEAALSAPERTAFNYFRSKGYSAVQAAGIVGNLMQESSVNPQSVEYGGGPGRGIAQWSVGGRWDTSRGDNMAWYARTNGVSIYSLQAQLDFINFELENFPAYGGADLQATTTIRDATLTFMSEFEVCGTCASSKRLQYAQQVYNLYAGSSATGGTGGAADSAAGCYSSTLGREVPNNTCVQSRYDSQWYQCADGAWVDRWTDPDPCASVNPL